MSSGAHPSGETAHATPERFSMSGAYDIYLRGLHSYNKRTDQANDRAIDLLERATSVDPQLAPAFAALAQAYIEKFFRYDANEEWEELAFVAIEKARMLDPGLAAAYIAKGNLLWTRQRRFPHFDVLEQYQRALAIDPDNTEALNEMGKVLFHIGHLDQAAQSLTRALQIDSSLASARFRLSLTEMLRGNYARSLDLQRALPGISYGSSVTALRALNHHYLGRTDEGRRLLEKATADERQESDFNSIRAIFHALSEQTAEAEQDIAREIEISQGLGHYHHAVAYIAAARALMGQHDAAIEGIASAAEDGFPCYPWFERDPCLASIRSLPAFTALLAELRERWSAIPAPGQNA
jgi:tetratricopeptide (TPR) repeat protein